MILFIVRENSRKHLFFINSDDILNDDIGDGDDTLDALDDDDLLLSDEGS